MSNKDYDPFWFCSFGGCEGVCKECVDNCEMSIFVKERKKIATELTINIIQLSNMCRDFYEFQNRLVDFVKENYSVEVERTTIIPENKEQQNDWKLG